MTHRTPDPETFLSNVSRGDFGKKGLNASCSDMRTPEPDPCRALDCNILMQSVAVCREKRCCFFHARMRIADMEKEAEREQREREARRDG